MNRARRASAGLRAWMASHERFLWAVLVVLVVSVQWPVLKGFKHFETGKLRQNQVGQNQVRELCGGRFQGVFAVPGQIHRESPSLQRRLGRLTCDKQPLTKSLLRRLRDLGVVVEVKAA